MKKKFGLILCVIMAFVLTMGVLGGCNKDEDIWPFPKDNPYHAGSINNSIKKSFLYAEENRINISYKNENYDPNDPDSTEYVCDGTLPSGRIILLTEQAQLEEAFEEAPAIELDTKMVMIVLFPVFEEGEWFYNIKFENGILEVIIASEFNKNCTMPILGEYVLQLDKIDESEISHMKITSIIKKYEREEWWRNSSFKGSLER